jgi:hypothetical protein
MIMTAIQAERLTSRPANEWHVYALGAWHVIEYDGYAPDVVEIGGRVFHVQRRHIGRDCHLTVCGR